MTGRNKEKTSMKTYRLIVAKKDKDIFDMIRDGRKKVETRAGGPKYQNVAVVDAFIFSCAGRTCKKTVSKVKHFKTMQAVFKTYRPEQIAPSTTNRKDLIDMWNRFPNYTEKIAESGVF